MRGSIRIGKIFGIPIGLHYSWFLIFAFFTISLSLAFSDTKDWTTEQCWLLGAATSLLLFVSVLTHELAHSIIAIRNGVPVKSITLFIFGGVARIGRESGKPSTEFRLAIAGPLCSMMLAGFFALIWWLTHNNNDYLAELTGWLSWINASLAIFNLIPGFPLDGGRVLRSIIWGITHNYRRATSIASNIGKGVAYLMIMGGIAFVLFGEYYSGIWLAFIGWFLNNAASTSNRQAEIRDSIGKFSVRDMMSRDCPLIPGDLSLRQLVQTHILPLRQRCFFVTDGDRMSGIITLDTIKAVPESKWDSITLSEVMIPAAEIETAQPDENALIVLDRMDEAEVDQMPVIEDGRLIGIIVREDMIRFIQTRAELGMQ